MFSEVVAGPDLRQISLANVAGPQRGRAWKDAVNDSFLSLETVVQDPDTLHGEISLRKAGQYHVAQISSSSQSVKRTAANVRKDPKERVIALLQLAGQASVFQADRLTTLSPGDFCLVESTRPYTFEFAGDFRQIVLDIPAGDLFERCRPAYDLTACNLNRTGGVGSMVFSFCQGIMNVSDVEEDVRIALFRQAIELFRLALNDSDGEGLRGLFTPVQRAHYSAARSYIERHLASPDLSVSTMSAYLGLSERYVRSIFALTGNGPKQVILARRLENARNDLSTGRVNWSVTDITYRWGFSSTSHFSSCFKARYGVTPRDFKNNG